MMTSTASARRDVSGGEGRGREGREGGGGVGWMSGLLNGPAIVVTRYPVTPTTSSENDSKVGSDDNEVSRRGASPTFREFNKKRNRARI